MNFLIIQDCDIPECAEFVTDDNGMNEAFSSRQHAEEWLEINAMKSTCYSIIDMSELA